MRRLTIQSVAACLAALICAALGASAATAKTPEFHTPSYPITLKASIGGKEQTFSAPSTSFRCEKSSFEVKLTKQPTTAIGVEKPELGCSTAEVPEMTQENNECAYFFSIEEEISAGKSKGSMSILCFGGPGIVLNSPDCKRTIPNQGSLKGITFKNIHPESGPGEIEISAELTNVKYEFVNQGEKKDKLCGFSGSNGTFSGAWKMKGYSGEKPVDISLGYGPFDGPLGYLVAEKSKMALKGSNPNTQLLTLNNKAEYPIECGKVTSQSTALYGQSEFALNPAFSGCKWPMGFVEASLTMNGCSFVMGIGHEALPGEFGGNLRIICPPENRIHVLAGGGIWPCNSWLPAQTMLSGVRYTPFTSESKLAVMAHMELEELYYEPSGKNNEELCARTDPGRYFGNIELLGYEDLGGGKLGSRIGIGVEHE